MERPINGGEEKLIDGHGSCRCDGNDKGGADGARREAYTAVDAKVGWRFFGRDRITPLSVIMLSGRGAWRQAKGRRTESVLTKGTLKNNAEDTVMVPSEMRKFWII